MKTLFGILISLLFVCNIYAQSNSDYEIYWTANLPVDSVTHWSVYLESHTNASTFLIQDGMEYSSQLDTFFIADVPNVGQTGEVVYTINLPNNGTWNVAGVIASNGIRSTVGASAKYKINKQPGQPGNVGIRKVSE